MPWQDPAYDKDRPESHAMPRPDPGEGPNSWPLWMKHHENRKSWVAEQDVDLLMVLLLAIFPRGDKPDDAGRLRNQEINAILQTYADGKTVHWLDIGPSFLHADGTLKRDLMPDALHPNLEGYRVWAEAMKPTLGKLMGGK
jgi:hypothetical protein